MGEKEAKKGGEEGLQAAADPIVKRVGEALVGAAEDARLRVHEALAVLLVALGW